MLGGMRNPMVNKELRIASTSYLMPTHPSWRATDYEISFMPYGILDPFVNLKSAPWVLVNILFYNDLLEANYNDTDKCGNYLDEWIAELAHESSEKNVVTLVISIFDFTSNFISELRQTSAERVGYEEMVKKLRKVSHINSNIYFLDSTQIFASSGFRDMFDDRNWYFARCRFSLKGIERLTECIHQFIERLTHAPHKVLVLDCDNTIWGGVIGEEGVAGIQLGGDGVGRAYQDFQRQIKRLAQSGVLIALISKNSEEDVMEVFLNHREMVLRTEDIIAHKINWHQKSLNIELLSREMGLSLDTFVFWDDNPIEREEMRSNCPEVNVIEPPSEIEMWPRFLEEMNFFTNFVQTTDDFEKIEQYKMRSRFIEEQKKAPNRKQFLATLKLAPESLPVAQDNLGRAQQLTQKTNQFNLNKNPLSLSDVSRYNADNSKFLRIIRLRDKFGDHGLVGLFGVSQLQFAVAKLDIFILSCRVLGRELEKYMLREIFNTCLEWGTESLLAEYVPNGRNEMVKNVLIQEGFREFGEGESLALYTREKPVNEKGQWLVFEKLK